MKWNDIKSAMHDLKDDAKEGEEDAFWNEFRARAAMVNQDKPGEPSDSALAKATPNWPLRAAVAFSCMAIVAIATVFLMPTDPAHSSPVAPVVASGDAVQELIVNADHDGQFILVDQASKSTIVWISFSAETTETH